MHIICDCSTGLQSSPGVALPRRGASHSVDPARPNEAARRREIKGSFARTAHRMLTLTFTSVGHPECVLGTARWRLRRALTRRVGPLFRRGGSPELRASSLVGPGARTARRHGGTSRRAIFNFGGLTDLSRHPWIEWRCGSIVDMSGCAGSSTRLIGLCIAKWRRSTPPTQSASPVGGLSGRRYGYHLSAAVDLWTRGLPHRPAYRVSLSPGVGRPKLRTISCNGSKLRTISCNGFGAPERRMGHPDRGPLVLTGDRIRVKPWTKPFGLFMVEVSGPTPDACPARIVGPRAVCSTRGRFTS